MSVFGFFSSRCESDRRASRIRSPASNRGIYECDYDRNPVPLYQAMEHQAWLPALEFFETGSWSSSANASSMLFSLFGSVKDPIPPERQARTWVTRYQPRRHDRDDDDDDDYHADQERNIRWSQLPIHAALIYQAPYRVIEMLLKLYPESVRCTNDQHRLPLHLALKHGASDNIVRLLCQFFPEGVQQRDIHGCAPWQMVPSQKQFKDRSTILQTFVEQALLGQEQKQQQQAENRDDDDDDQMVEDDNPVQVMVADLEAQVLDLQMALEAERQDKQDLKQQLQEHRAESRRRKHIEQVVSSQESIRSSIQDLELVIKASGCESSSLPPPTSRSDGRPPLPAAPRRKRGASLFRRRNNTTRSGSRMRGGRNGGSSSSASVPPSWE